MITIMMFIVWETQAVVHQFKYDNAWDCSEQLIPKIDELYPNGLPDNRYVVCDPTEKVGNSTKPKMRGV